MLVLLLANFHATLFFGYNMIIALKIFYTTYFFWTFLIFLEMIYGEPQPYWTNSLIVTDTCNPEYAMPGTMPPILLFSALYSYHCIKDAPSLYSSNFKIYNGFMYFIYAIVCIFLYLTGSLFIYQWLLTTIYCVLSYKLALKLE